MVRGFQLLKERHGGREKLILPGYNRSPSGLAVKKYIRKVGLEGDVFLPGNIPYRELPAVYQHAKVNIFASECENCPNILLEAMGAGRPTLVSDRKPMPEFGGEAVKYFDPTSPEDFAEKISALIDNPDVMNEFAEKARKQSQLFDWEKTATLTWVAMREVHCKEKVASK